MAVYQHRQCAVALLAEGVDRNFWSSANFASMLESPSSRRAWIEILGKTRMRPLLLVALLAEGVDRNGELLTEEGY